MGASQSARKISIENDDAANVIKISDSLVDRLRGGLNSVPNDASSSDLNRGHYGPISQDPNQPYYYPSFTALQVKKDMEEQLIDNNNYWMRRIEDLELEHKKIDFIMEQEFEKAVENVKQRFRKLPTAHGVPPCLENKSRIIKCFQENSERPIECAKEVKLFAQCVNKERAELLHKRG